MPYPKKEHRETWKNIDKMLYKSIELGFNGNITQEFYKKLKSTTKVRQKLKAYLLFFTLLFSMSFIGFCFTDKTNIITKVGLCLMGVISCIYIMKNIKIWYEIRDIREQRFKKYYEKNNIRT